MADPPQPRLVLDTNTVMALWFFEDPVLARLSRFLDDTRPTLITRADALEELRRVLAYRQFGIDRARQDAILSAYSARATSIDASSPAPESTIPGAALPACRDSDDQKFLEIARDGGATHLVSRDKALLRLDRHRMIRPRFAILSPEALVASLPPG